MNILNSENNQSSPLTWFEKNKKSISITGAILAVLVIIVFSLYLMSSSETVDDSPYTNLDVAEEQATEYVNEKYDLRLELPLGWEPLENIDESLKRKYAGVVEMPIVFKKGSCVAGLVSVDEDVFWDTYKQVSFGSEVFNRATGEGRYIAGADWYVTKEQYPSDFEFDFDVERHYFPYEFWKIALIESSWFSSINNPETRESFILSDTESEHVSDECAHEFVEIVQSMSREFYEADYYNENRYVVLSKYSHPGVSYLYKTDGEGNLTEINDANGRHIQVAPLRFRYFEEKVELSDGRLFFHKPFGEELSFGIFNPLSETFEIIRLAEILGESVSSHIQKISDYIPNNNKIYFLLGLDTCNEYMGQCEASLYEFDMVSKKLLLIKSNISDDRIELDSQNQILAVSHGFGDAGEFSRTYTFFDIHNNYALYGTFSYSSDDEGNLEKTRRYERIQSGIFK